MNEIKSTDSTKIVEHLEKGAKFDMLKTREGNYRNWDHQLMQEMYTITLQAGERDQGQVGSLHVVGAGARGQQSLEVIEPTREETLHDAGVIDRTPRGRARQRFVRSRCHGA